MLRMDATRRDSADGIIPGRATSYLWGGPVGLRNAEFLKYLMMNHGDRGIVSTVLDLAKWDNALEEEGLLSRENRDAMWQPVKLNDGSSHDYGLGWFLGKLNGHRHIYHPGGVAGTASIVSRYPDDRLTVIILTNGGAAYPQARWILVSRSGIFPTFSAEDRSSGGRTAEFVHRLLQRVWLSASATHARRRCPGR